MDSYRVEKQAMRKIMLADEDAEIDPVPTAGGGHQPEAQMERLSYIVVQFNDLFGDIEWDDVDRVHKLITETIPARVAEDKAYRNAQRNSDTDNAKIEHERALGKVMISVLNDNTTLYRHFVQNPSFKRWLDGPQFQAVLGTPRGAGGVAGLLESGRQPSS